MDSNLAGYGFRQGRFEPAVSMDVDHDGDADMLDVEYLFKVLGHKYRFLTDFGTSPFPLTLNATVRDAASNAALSGQAKVTFELATRLNDGITETSGMVLDFPGDGEPEKTASGILLRAEERGVDPQAAETGAEEDADDVRGWEERNG